MGRALGRPGARSEPFERSAIELDLERRASGPRALDRCVDVEIFLLWRFLIDRTDHGRLPFRIMMFMFRSFVWLLSVPMLTRISRVPGSFFRICRHRYG